MMATQGLMTTMNNKNPVDHRPGLPLFNRLSSALNLDPPAMALLVSGTPSFAISTFRAAGGHCWLAPRQEQVFGGRPRVIEASSRNGGPFLVGI